MTSDEIMLQDVFRLVLSRPDLEITPEMSMESTKGWDSFAHLELMLLIEDSFGIEFEADVIPTILDVASILEAIDNHRSGSPS